MIQTEAERQFYLGMSGIRMWYARDPLPGAAPSPDYDFGVQEPEAVAVPEVPVMPAAPRARRADPEQASRNRDKIARLQSLMEPSAKAPASVGAESPVSPAEAPAPGVEAIEPEPVPAEPVTVAEDVPRLNLKAWTGRRVTLIAELSEDSSLALQETLARNILRSLGEDACKASDSLHWPVFNNLKVSLNGAEHLAVALGALFRGLSGQKVVVLGKVGDWYSQALGREPEVVFETSLATLATDPERKRQLWHLIKPLKA